MDRDWEVQRQIAQLKKRMGRVEPKGSGTYQQSDAPGVAAYLPTYLGGAVPGVTTYSLQQGFWIRIGNVVFVTGNVTWTAATGTGNAQVSLPFTPTYRGAGALWIQNVTFANGTPQIQIAAQPFFLMYSPLTNNAGAIVQMEAAGDIRFTCVLFL